MKLLREERRAIPSNLVNNMGRNCGCNDALQVTALMEFNAESLSVYYCVKGPPAAQKSMYTHQKRNHLQATGACQRGKNHQKRKEKRRMD